MSFLKDHTLEIRNHFKVTESDVQRDVGIIREWMKQQAHLPKVELEDSFLEKFLMRNKYQVEPTKQKIDAYYTLRGLNKEIFDFPKDFKPSEQSLLGVPIEELTPDFERVFIFKIINEDAKDFDHFKCIQSAVMVMELLNLYDTSTGMICLIDNKGVGFDIIKKFSPAYFQSGTRLFKECYGFRPKGLYFLHGNAFVTTMTTLIKPILKDKVFARIASLPNEEKLHEVIDKKYLPSDYSGDQKSFREYAEILDKEAAKHRDHFEKMKVEVSNEKLRVGETPYKGELFGLNGTFKQINLD